MSRRFVWSERRTGFDRRGASGASAPATALNATLVYLRDNASSLIAVLALANLLSVLDLVFTLRALGLGAQEANPLMRALFQESPLLAGGVKVGVIALLTVGIWCFRRYRLILKVALFAAAVYACVTLYHLYGLSQL